LIRSDNLNCFKKMNIIFFGSSKFAVPALKKISLAGYNIACVITQPDQKKGRGLKNSFTPVKEAALELGLKVRQPARLRNREEIEFLKKVDADLFIVIAYGRILSAEALGIPRIFAVNLHASLLPKYRGAAPINWVLINGEKITGNTIIRMNEKPDEGDIIAQQPQEIDEDDTESTLEEKLAVSGAELLISALPGIAKGSCRFIVQDGGKATLAPKLNKHNGAIDWAKTATQIRNLIRGVNIWPGAFTRHNGKILKIHSAQVISEETADLPGTITQASSAGIIVAAGKYKLLIKELQAEGKRKMTAKDFISGYKLAAGQILG